jgi:hypothetical protein
MSIRGSKVERNSVSDQPLEIKYEAQKQSKKQITACEFNGIK